MNSTGTDKKGVYGEKAPYSNTLKAITTLGFLALALAYSFAIFAPSSGFKEMQDDGFFVLNFVLIIYCLAMWSFFSMKFTITDSSVEAVMLPFRYRLSFSKIEDVTTIDRIPWYVGWGLRLWGRRLAFVSMHKKAVVIEKKKGVFRRLVLTTQNPDDFVGRLKEAMKKLNEENEKKNRMTA